MHSNASLAALLADPAASLQAIQRIRTRRAAEAERVDVAQLLLESFAEFVRGAWPIIEPGKQLVWNWHHDAKVELLEAMTRGDVLRAIINEPPRFTKSTFTSVCWQPWVWLRAAGGPSLGSASDWYCWSYDKALSNRDNIQSRRLIQSQWYTDLLLSLRGSEAWTLTRGENRITRYSNTDGGRRQAHAVNAGGTGWGGDYIVGDDPHNAKDVESDAMREQTLAYWRKTLPTRENDPHTTRWVLNGQRTHSSDVFEHEISLDLTRDVKRWFWLCVPLRFGRQPEGAPVSKHDPRTEPEQSAWEGRFTPEVIDRLDVALADEAAGQLDQNPTQPGGNMIKAKWLDKERWSRLPEPDEVQRAIAYFDLTFGSESATASGNCMHLYFQLEWRGKLSYLLVDRDWERGGAAVQDGMILNTAEKWKRYRIEMVVERKAEGRRAVEGLIKRLPGLVSAEPPKGTVKDRKIVAFQAAVVPLARAGQLILPDDSVHPWAREVRRIWMKFPKIKPDDDADCASGGLWELWGGEPEWTIDDILVIG